MYDGPSWPCRKCNSVFMLCDEDDIKLLGNYYDGKNYINVHCPNCGETLNWTDIDADLGLNEII